MAYTRRISYLVLSIMVLSASSVLPVEALEQNQQNAIIQNCDNIKSSLQKLQHSDSRTRTYLGSTYEAINGHFITPLNLRLVKSNFPSADLFQIQNDFAASQSSFRNNYVDYMRELENLITIDCIMQPKDFYKKLETVRNKREKLRTDTKNLSDLASKQYQTVQELQKNL